MISCSIALQVEYSMQLGSWFSRLLFILEFSLLKVIDQQIIQLGLKLTYKTGFRSSSMLSLLSISKQVILWRSKHSKIASFESKLALAFLNLNIRRISNILKDEEIFLTFQRYFAILGALASNSSQIYTMTSQESLKALRGTRLKVPR